MVANLQGADQLKARLKAVHLAFKPLGRQWADTAVELARPRLPVRSASMRAGDGHSPGRLHGSIRRLTATQKVAKVGAHYTAYFIDAGVKPHSMTKRAAGQDRTVFAAKHPGYRARPFRVYIAHESLRRHPMAETIIAEWNRGA
jgi:hypothetical protein